MRIFITLAAAALSSVASVTAHAAELPANFDPGRTLVNANALAPAMPVDFVKTGTNIFQTAAYAPAPDWRYRFYRGEWWYWMPANFWMYFRNGNWITYDPAAYQPLVVTGPSYYPYSDGYYGNGYYGGYRYNRYYYGPGYSFYRYPGYRYGYYGYGYRPNYYSYYRTPGYRDSYGYGPYRYGYRTNYGPSVRIGAGVGRVWR